MVTLSDNAFTKSLLGESRKRMVGSLMGYIEKEVYPHLNKQQQQDLRAKLLLSVGAYHDVCIDMIKASVADGVITNEYLLEALYDLRDEVREL